MFASVFVKHLQYCLIYIYMYTHMFIFRLKALPILRPWHAPWILPQRSHKMQNGFLSWCHSTDKNSVLYSLFAVHLDTFGYCMRQVPFVLHTWPCSIPLPSFKEKGSSRRSKGTRRQLIFPEISAVSRGGETPGVLAVEHEVECVHDSVVVVQNMFNCVKRHI